MFYRKIHDSNSFKIICSVTSKFESSEIQIDSQNRTTVYRGYLGNYAYNPSNLRHGSDFRHQSAALHLPTCLPC